MRKMLLIGEMQPDDPTQPAIRMMYDGRDLFIFLGDKKIARRGQPDTPEAMTWVSLLPGYAVENDENGDFVVTSPRWHAIRL